MGTNTIPFSINLTDKDYPTERTVGEDGSTGEDEEEDDGTN